MHTEQSSQPKPLPESGFRQFMHSHTARFMVIAFLLLLLMIPLIRVQFLIDERGSRQEHVIDQLSTEWGGPLDYYGLLLRVPLLRKDGKESEPDYLYILPEQSRDSFQTRVHSKYRGIFKAHVFRADIEASALIGVQNITAPATYLTPDWQHVQACLITGEAVNFKELEAFRVDGQSYALETQVVSEHNRHYLETLSAPFAIDPTTIKDLHLELSGVIQGAQSIKYRSFGQKSTLKTSSNWADPSFSGNNLPDPESLRISSKGFAAEWHYLDVGRGTRKAVSNPFNSHAQNAEITFIDPVDQYVLNERTAKYGLLVFALTFAIIFLIQVVGKVDVHPLHYLLIGLSLVLFYTLLLALSEQIGFTPAYCISSAVIIALFTWYARSVLKSARFAILSGGSLALTYGFILVIVNLETYALLMGSIGLLIVLAAIMSVTRKLNFDR